MRSSLKPTTVRIKTTSSPTLPSHSVRSNQFTSLQFNHIPTGNPHTFSQNKGCFCCGSPFNSFFFFSDP
ncbi:hypothetical protein PEXP_005700 [Penicillium expansum]|nr:hypothetical protein PEXP_005700 [Penicillium expansum]